MGSDATPSSGLSLPPTWDPARDLVVWIGPPGPGLPRGARVFLMPGEPLEQAPPETHVVESEGELFRGLIAMVGAAPRHALVHRAPGIDAELHRRAAEIVRNGLRSRAMQQRTVAESGTTWLRQGLSNLPALAAHPSITRLAGACAGTPCILVSPGPSLSRHLAALKDLAQRALILSGTHALRALAQAGVTPHLALCCDPGDLSRHWQGLDTSGIEAWCVAATCRPEAFAVPARRVLTFGGNGALDDWLFEALRETPRLATGGSVACSMYSLALHLGCDPIVLVGQDLSFGERFYSAEGLDGDARVVPSEDGTMTLVKPAGAQGIGRRLADGSLRFAAPRAVLEVPGWSGGSVRTTPQLKTFLDWFEATVPTTRGRTRVVNCTEGGAHIAGLEHLPLSEVSAGFGPLPALAPVLDATLAGHDVGARRAALGAWTRRTLAGLETCRRLARTCRARSGKNEPRALARSEKELARALREVPLVSLAAQQEITEAREAGRQARTLEENLAAARRLYTIVERTGALLAEPLRDAEAALARAYAA